MNSMTENDFIRNLCIDCCVSQYQKLQFLIKKLHKKKDTFSFSIVTSASDLIKNRDMEHAVTITVIKDNNNISYHVCDGANMRKNRANELIKRFKYIIEHPYVLDEAITLYEEILTASPPTNTVSIIFFLCSVYLFYFFVKENVEIVKHAHNNALSYIKTKFTKQRNTTYDTQPLFDPYCN